MTTHAMVADYVNEDRLWRSLLEMAEIGATSNGGSSRLAFTPEDDAGRALYAAWCEDAGLTLSRDIFGNMFGLRRGRLNIEPLMIGSHLDTQPKGGRFDGVLGVLGGLEVVRALNDANIVTERPIVLVNWTNEEGAVLTPMMGSAVFTGALPAAEALACVLPDGRSTERALSEMRFGSALDKTISPIHAYLELHIEQGPVLENEHINIGVVTGGIGFRRFKVRIQGQEAHAGPTPMSARKDPVVAAARAVLAADTIARRVNEARSTVGTLSLGGGSPNTVAEIAEFTLDLRHSEAGMLDAMENEFAEALQSIALETQVSAALELVTNSSPAPFDVRVVSAVEDAASSLALTHKKLPSGAGHDACNLSRVFPTGMIFVPSVGGLSHNEAEFTSRADCAAGVRVLAGASARLTNR